MSRRMVLAMIGAVLMGDVGVSLVAVGDHHLKILGMAILIGIVAILLIVDTLEDR